MPKDAKFGLILGVGLVMLIAFVFFRKDLVTGAPPANEAMTAKEAVAVGKLDKSAPASAIPGRE
jgi:hypothetical protein